MVIALALAARDENNHMSNKHNAKYAFYYLLSLVALVFTAQAVGMICFGIINQTVADVLVSYSGSDSQLKFAISALFIAAPIFYVMSWLIARGLRRGELEKDSAIRRWLTYFILLISSLVVLGVFIGTINVFLGGELTSRFILKALTIFVIAAAAFSYYFYEIKRNDPDKKDKVVTIYFWASLVVVLAVFIAAWFFVEPPKIARARRLDQALTNNISNLEAVVNNYYERYKKLPDDLAAVQGDANIYLNSDMLVDPETKAPIAYHKLGDKSFEFCATFRLDSATDNGRMPVSYVGDGKNHRAGYQCLTGNLYVLPAKAKLLD